jgi:hypothetical protein
MNRRIAVPTVRARASLLAALAVASVSPAMAYIDPGTGSMLVQMALAGVAGALFYFRQLRLAAVDWFRRVILRQAPAAEPTSSVSETIS